MLLSGPILSVASAQAQSFSVPSTPPPLAPSAQQTGAVARAIYDWKALRQAPMAPFLSYSNFMLSHPGWPGEAVMRKAAEKNLRPDGEPASSVIAFFRKYPPLTPTGRLRFADALFSSGMINEAQSNARKAWLGGTLAPEDEARLLSRYGTAISVADHDARMENLLWSRSTTNAARQIGFVSQTRRQVFDARLAMLTKSPDAALKRSSIEPIARNDPGFIVDKVFWFRNTGNLPMARATLASPLTLSAPPLDPAKWLNSLYETAKNASADQQWETVWNIARQSGSTYPAGTSVRDRPFDERDDYTSLTWLGGMTSLNKRGRPADAVVMFDLYANAARSPQTRAKGLYWAGRAADAAGQAANARQYYERAALFFDQFHGQLATERLGKPLSPPAVKRTLELSGAARSAFENSSVVKAATYLGSIGQWQDQTQFVRVIAANAVSDVDHYLASELAVKLNRPDLNVLIGRSAREDGFDDYLTAAFPQMTVPSEHSANWTMIHAITRQESQFDREAMSPVGARGLMQLMPGTARDTAPHAGLSYNLSSLTQDPHHNIRLGSTYFGQLMDRFGGSYVLSVAAYNAGPGNVNKWLRTNGDPRLPGTDVIAWIEAIPFAETRSYVQRVLENAVVYDMINPSRATVRSKTPLSTYLGKSQPG